MGNQQRQGYTQGGFSGFQQGPYNSGPSNRPIQQGPNIFQRTEESCGPGGTTGQADN